jgi:excisionase family DNA binding protein
MISVDPSNVPGKNGAETPCLAVRPRVAAKALGVSERTLWEWTNRGIVPHVRLGKAILYPVDSLRDWLRQRTQATVAEQSDAERQI